MSALPQAKTANPATQDSPEWLREKEVTRQFGLTHMPLFNLRKRGAIRSASLKAEGAKYGVRLYHVGSIRDYIDRMERAETAGKIAAQV